MSVTTLYLVLKGTSEDSPVQAINGDSIPDESKLKFYNYSSLNVNGTSKESGWIGSAWVRGQEPQRRKKIAKEQRTN